MKIVNVNTLNTQIPNSSHKTAFGVSQATDSEKNNELNTKNITTAVSALGAVGLATFFILSRKPQKVNASIKNLQYVENKVPQMTARASLKKIPAYSQDLVGEASVELNEHFAFLKRRPENFYLQNGRQINKFLRNGELKELPIITDDIPESFRTIVEEHAIDAKNFNRAIVESIAVLDSKMTSRTTSPMTVYRDAPASWLKTAKDGIIKDDGFVSTSTVPGASLEGIIGSNAHLNKRYEIRIPENFPYLDLTYTSEKEMLLPRGLSFRVISDDILEVIV